MLSKSKSVSPDNEDYEEDTSVLPGSMGSESESLLSLPAPRTSLATVEERLEHRPLVYANSSDDETDNEQDERFLNTPNSHFPLSSVHSLSTPHLFADIDNFNFTDSHSSNKKTRASVPSIGIDTETESGFGSNRGTSEQSLNNCSEYNDSLTESDPEFDGDDDNVLSLLDIDGSVVSPTNESSQSTPHRSSNPSVSPRQRKSSSFKRDWPGRQVIAKRTVSLHIPRNKDATTKKPLHKSASHYLSSSLSQLQQYGENSPSPVSLDRYMSSGAISCHSDHTYSSETNSPWGTPLHKLRHHQTQDLTDFSHNLATADNETSDTMLLCNDDTLAANDNTVTNERLNSSSTSMSDDPGEEKAAREQNTTENDKEMALENQIRNEFKKVDGIGDRLFNIGNGSDAESSVFNQSPTSEDGISIHEVKLDVRSLSPLSESSLEGEKNFPYHSPSNSMSSTEIHFIHKQHDSTASEQSMDAQNKPINHDQLTTLSLQEADHVSSGPQRYRRLIQITPTLNSLSLSRSTSDVSSDMKPKEKHSSSLPKGGGFKLSLKRKNSLVESKENENRLLPLSLSRDKSKSTNELYNKGWASGLLSGLPKFRKTKSNGRSKQFEVVTSSSHSTSPKSKRKRSRAPLYV